MWTAADRRDALTAYAQLYLKEEVQAEALVRNLPGFARFLPVAALFHGQVINVSGLARDAGAARTTVNATSRSSETRYSRSACRRSRRSCACASATIPSSTGPTRDCLAR